MSIAKKIRSKISNYFWLRTLEIHKSRMGRVDAPKYTKHHKQAKKIYKVSQIIKPEAKQAVDEYKETLSCRFSSLENMLLANSLMEKILVEERTTDIWDKNYRYKLGDIYHLFPEIGQLFKGEANQILHEIFKSEYMIFYGVMYKSINSGLPASGSQLWHSDGGPGTCINMMFCLNETNVQNGAMECLPWDVSMNIFRKERVSMKNTLATIDVSDRLGYRESISNYYNKKINENHINKIKDLSGPAGSILFFSNNTIHKGGYPEIGQTRYVCVFHIYPSLRTIQSDEYIEKGIIKQSPYPQDPYIL
jgi:phytanoyl-CoA dioxygenase PhyH